MIEISTFMNVISQFGLPLVAVYALMKGWVITSIHHKEQLEDLKAQIAELREERDEWKLMALDSSQVARAVTIQEERKRPQ